MKSLITLVGLILIMNSCNHTKKTSDVIEQSEIVELFVIDNFATHLDEQNPDEMYIMDYQIFNQIQLTDSQQIIIKTYISNPENYTENTARSCPFIGEFGLAFHKGNKVLNMIIGKANCPKSMVYNLQKEEMVISDFKNALLVEQLKRY